MFQTYNIEMKKAEDVLNNMCNLFEVKIYHNGCVMIRLLIPSPQQRQQQSNSEICGNDLRIADPDSQQFPTRKIIKTTETDSDRNLTIIE